MYKANNNYKESILIFYIKKKLDKVIFQIFLFSITSVNKIIN